MSYVSKLVELCNTLGCNYLLDEPLKYHTTFKVGGNCKIFIEVNSVDTITTLLKYFKSNGIQYAILGNGSNVIASDEGFNGAVLHFGKDFSNIELLDDTTIKSLAGTVLSKLCLLAKDNSLTGLEFAYGIPGTVGGALYMNAGAYGGEMSDVVVSAEYIDSNGDLQCISAKDMNLAYRQSIFAIHNDMIIVSVTIKCEHGDAETIKNTMEDLLSRRKSKQPLEYPSAGSTFKRPVGNYASKLIDDCGLKGLSCGDAQVSEKHCGFVVNKGNATCNDIIKLTNKVIEIVHQKTGYTLELEPKILK